MVGTLISTHNHMSFNDLFKSALLAADRQALEPVQPFTVIASSLAKIGGGGGYLRVSLNRAEQKALNAKVAGLAPIGAIGRKTGGVLKN